MNNKKLTERMLAIFGATMVFFYIGLGIFIIISPQLNIDKSLRIIFAVPLMLYGVYRAFASYRKFKESFFSDDDG
jgi:Ca2+/Na+ antiporter